MNKLSDTHPEIESIQIEFIRNAPLWRRLEMVNSLTSTVRQLSWEGIRHRYSSETEEELVIRFFSFLYGDVNTARKIICQLNSRGTGELYSYH